MGHSGAEVDVQRLPIGQAFRAFGNRPEQLKRAPGQVARQAGDPTQSCRSWQRPCAQRLPTVKS